MKSALRNAIVIDGSGDAPVRADVLIEGSRIRRVGTVGEGEADEQVDLSGLVLAPGFIDIHTHYDAQVFWDADLTPSSWHGVTSVVIANCGFGLAPISPPHRDVMLDTLANVEGMSRPALESGVDWNFETFPQLLDAIERLPKRINVAVMLGHTPLRMYAMGDASWQRAATDAEIAQMKSLAHEALEAGAVGFTTTNSPQHVGAFGLPVPSRFSTVEEIEGIADVLRVTGRGVLQGTLGPEMTVAAFNQIARTSERPVLWSAILAKRDDHNYVPQLLEAFERYGRNTTPQFACKPIVTQISLREPSTLGNIPAFQTMLGVPANERKTMYRDRRWRDEAKQGARALWGDRLDRAIVRETRAATELLHAGPLTELAPAGIDPIDFLFDIAVADDLETRFEITMINDDDDQIAGLLRDNRLILSLSDAGAHASQLCDADYSSHLLGHWCRERAALPLELAIWRLTAHPAATFGLTDRGLLREGYVADLVAFDPDTVAGDMLERIYDFPRGTDRLVSRSHGISDVWVAGRQIRRRGTPIAGAHPGALLRSSDPPNTLQ